MEITLTDLAKETKFSLTHIGKLIERGILPKGRVEGAGKYRHRYLPYVESILILGSHLPNKHWVKGKARNTKGKWKKYL